jgi:hypothetical protein
MRDATDCKHLIFNRGVIISGLHVVGGSLKRGSKKSELAESNRRHLGNMCQLQPSAIAN